MQRLTALVMVLMVLLTACAAPTATNTPSVPTSTTRPFPTFPPPRTRTPTKTSLPPSTATAASMPEPTDTPTPTLTARSISSAASDARQPLAIHDQFARSDVPAVLRSALINAGVNDPKVYWFTFDAGDHEEALMIQYVSPLHWQPGYLEMMRAAKLTLGRYYLQIDPPLYTAIIAATDLTGQSDLVVRLRRSAAEKWAHGDIGNDDFVNNYFEFVQVVVNCTVESCTAKMATPFPSFNFPFPFPTPTPNK